MWSGLYDFIPLLAFFVAFKFYGIYVATAVGIGMTLLQLLIIGIAQKRLDKRQLLILAIFVVFGGLTLYFHNPIFVKWKPTVIFWLFGIAFLANHFKLVGNIPLVQTAIQRSIPNKEYIPTEAWKKLNLAWAIFFIVMGSINLFFAYTFSTNIWVNFKFYGILGCVAIFSLFQALYISRFKKISGQ
jgi:intracellular septation protein